MHTPTIIEDLMQYRAAILAAADGLPKDLFGHVDAAVMMIEQSILETPAASGDDLQIKVEFWDEMIAMPQRIDEDFAATWSQLKADFGAWRYAPRAEEAA